MESQDTSQPSAVPANDTAQSVQQPQNVVTSKEPKKKSGSKIVIVCGVLFFIGLLIIGLVIGGYFLLKNSEEEEEISTTTTTQESDGEEADMNNDLILSIYVQDTDGDGFVDFVEEATDYDPDVNECLQEAGCGDVKGASKPDQDTNILIILDASSSMEESVGGSVKMDVAKEAINSFVDQVPEDINVGFMVYGHKGSAGVEGKAESCEDPEILVPIQKVNKSLIKQKVDSFDPTGWTPIAGSLNLAKTAFKDMVDEDNKIILVSDGEETCGGDPCSIAQTMKQSGIAVTVDVVGFAVNSATGEQLECVARVTDGAYYHAQTSQALLDYFSKKGEETQKLSEALGCLSENLAKYSSCVSVMYAKASSYLIQEETSATIDGDDGKSENLEKVRIKLNKVFKDMIYGSIEETMDEGDELLDDFSEE